ncbi:MAG: DUF2442 domain-containing protein [Gemmatimonas sp.]|nr:DUF2442 domain-containing protein [Gemmatimonas sp.]
MARKWTPLDDEQLDREIEDARKRSKIVSDSEPRAVGARYNRRSRRIEVELADGCLFAFPVKSAQGLDGATADQLAEVEVLGDGYALHWEKLDADFTVAGLLAGRLGSRAWMREHARRAGSVTSGAKARAARANGRKGGRPRKGVSRGTQE